mmetsp:Transcript_150241/g.273557  ORF Transcript_150241/g.273557 Transcript_150241/m.273557 type:complete len:306 (+) Transcript_150241:130-1047(+)
MASSSNARRPFRKQAAPGLDTNAEAKRFIEFTESGPMRSPYSNPPTDEGMVKLKEAFKELDKDNSGSLSFDEVQGLLTRTMMEPDPANRPGWAPPGAGVVGGIGFDGKWVPTPGGAAGREFDGGASGFGGFPAMSPTPPTPAGGYPVNAHLMQADGVGGEDPWAAILAAGSEEFCVVPAVTLERLRAVGEAQLAEIEALRAEIAKCPEVKEETRRLELQLEELEVARVCAENELELRRLEAGKLGQEASVLRQQRDALVGQVKEAKARVEQLEKWLEPGKQGGPLQASRAEEGGVKQQVGEAFYG